MIHTVYRTNLTHASATLALMLDLRFASATQLMLSLALAQEQGIPQLSSSDLSSGLGIAASFVRNLLVPLVRDGLVATNMGKTGGLRLALPASKITLGDIYSSVQKQHPLWNLRQDAPHQCLVSTNIVPFLEGVQDEALAAILKSLRRLSLRDALRRMRQIDGTAPIRKR